MTLFSKLVPVASVFLTGAFGFLQAQNNSGEKLHQRVYEHYDQREIDHFTLGDIRQMNWYMTRSFIIDRTITSCSECSEFNVDTFDVIRYDYLRKDDERVRVELPRMKHPLFLFSKNEVLQTIREIKYTAPNPNTDTTIMICSGTIYDPGGQFGNYSIGMDTTITYCATTPGQCITVTFNTSAWSMSDSYCGSHDALIIYDGPDTTSAWIGNFGTTLNIPSNQPTTITSQSGCLTFQLVVDPCSPGAGGWEASITCAPCTPLPPPQGSCSNVDFELGNLNGWQGTTGTNYASTWTQGIVAGQHTLTSGPGNDPCGGFPVVAPGGSFSVQLGNNQIGAFSEQIYQRFTVTNQNANFLYQYATVLENPSHAFFDQPFFKIEVFNDSFNLVQCGYYYVAAGNPLFTNCQGSTQYIPWSFQAVDLIPYIGQTVTIRYTTADCARTGHYGYAYIDCSCNPFVLQVDSTLCPGETALLVGPNGYTNYSWSPGGQTTQSITVSQPGTYCVSVSVGGNCQTNTLCGTVEINPSPNAQFSFLPESPMILEQMPVCFTNMSTIDSGSIAGYSWFFDDPLNSQSTLTNPCFTYLNEDSFCIRLVAISDMGCTDTTENCLEVVPDSIFVPNVFSPNGDTHNDVFHFPNMGYINLHCDIYNRWGNHIYAWDGVDGGWDGNTKSGPASDGTYYYVMWAERIDAQIFKSHGFLTLLRNK